jgi:hypothetical protein
MSTSPHSNTATLRRFVSALTALVNRSQDEALLVREGSALLRELIAREGEGDATDMRCAHRHGCAADHEHGRHRELTAARHLAAVAELFAPLF